MADLIKSLGFNAPVFLMQVVLVLLVMVVMNFVFWKPMLAHLSQREKNVADAYKTRDTLQHEMETLRAEYLARITQVEAEARSHIQTAIKEAQAERERLLADARAHAEATLTQGIADMEREKTQALEALQGGMAGMALTAANKALGSAGDETALRTTIEQRIAQEAARN